MSAQASGVLQLPSPTPSLGSLSIGYSLRLAGLQRSLRLIRRSNFHPQGIHLLLFV
jgi:hypothetical protein